MSKVDNVHNILWFITKFLAEVPSMCDLKERAIAM